MAAPITPSPEQDPLDFQTIDYKHDVYGRRSEKKVDGFSTRYLYDGPQVIAEYDGNNNLLRKYIYGPGIDQPVCMIEVADSNAVYYYHYDGLGSVVALSDSSGDTVQTYEYSVYGQVAVEDINHPNPYMFAGRRFDIEIGLYYNRARYYNPFTGRFLQADPIGYEAGMNLYQYCCNNPVGLRDPSGRDPCDPCSAGTSDVSEEYGYELPPGYDFGIDDQTDNYACVGYIVVPMRLDPGYVLLSYKASKGAFEVPKSLGLWLKGSGYDTFTALTLRSIGVFTYPYVKAGVLYAIKKGYARSCL